MYGRAYSGLQATAVKLCAALVAPVTGTASLLLRLRQVNQLPPSAGQRHHPGAALGGGQHAHPGQQQLLPQRLGQLLQRHARWGGRAFLVPCLVCWNKALSGVLLCWEQSPY